MAQSVTAAATGQQRTSRVIDHTPFFYGWVILIAGTLGIVMMGPSQTFTFSLFIDPLVTGIGLSRSAISLIYGLATLGAALLLPVTGRLVDRYGTRILMVFATLGFGMACIAMSQVTSAVTLLVALLAVRFLGFGSMQLVSNNVIAQWFVRRRGMVMGLSGQSLAISLLIFPLLTEFLIARLLGAALGLLWAYWCAPSCCPLPGSFSEIGRNCMDYSPMASRSAGKIYPDIANEENWTLAQAAHTAVFWTFTIRFPGLAMITAGLVFHQASLFQVRGLSRTTAVYAFQVMAVVSIVGNLTTGRLLDKVSARLLLTVVLMLLAAALILVQVMSTLLTGMVYASLIGLVTGSFRVMDSTVWAKYFGRRYLGSIRGATMIGTVGGTALGAFPLGYSFDSTGSYTPAIAILLILPISISLSMIFVRRPERRNE